MINSKDFTKRLEKIMSHYDITATALAEKIEFNRSSISHLISGRNKPSLEFVMKILKNFDAVSWEWLVFGKGHFPSRTEEPRDKTKSTMASDGNDAIHTPDLFSQKPASFPIEQGQSEQTIERIVVFYTNGTFKNYELP